LRVKWREEVRALILELVEETKVFPDHLEVKLSGSLPLNVRLSEAGLKVPGIVGVGGPTQQNRRIAPALGSLAGTP
jgi:hypothetical protein